MPRIQVVTPLAAPPNEVFRALVSAENWAAIIPRLLRAKVVEGGPLREGSTLKLRVSRYGLDFDWILQMREVVPDQTVRFQQLVGFFDRWEHSLEIVRDEDGRTLVKETVEYEMPLGLLGRVADDLVFRQDLYRILKDRQNQCLARWGNL